MALITKEASTDRTGQHGRWFRIYNWISISGMGILHMQNIPDRVYLLDSNNPVFHVDRGPRSDDYSLDESTPLQSLYFSRLRRLSRVKTFAKLCHTRLPCSIKCNRQIDNSEWSGPWFDIRHLSVTNTTIASTIAKYDTAYTKYNFCVTTSTSRVSCCNTQWCFRFLNNEIVYTAIN